MRSSTRRTQPTHPRGLKGDDGNAQHAGAAGGADATPVSSCRRFKAWERPQEALQASSPPVVDPDQNYDEGEAMQAEFGSGAAALGLELGGGARLRG
jgi:hypothetical protein